MSTDINRSLLPQLINKLFQRLEHKYLQISSKELLPEDLLELHGLFGNILESALDIIDREKIKIVRAQSRIREYIEIFDRNGQVHKLFPNINYCPCHSFRIQVLQLQSQYTCKHVLAAKLAQLLDKQKEEILADDLFNSLIEQISTQQSIDKP